MSKALAATSPELTIDKEFAGLCPRPTAEELDLLEVSLVAEGCRDPIITWANHDDAILDGYTRYSICQAEKIPFKIKPIKLDSRGDCINWIIANQLGRRNLTDEQKAFLRGRRYGAEKLAPNAPEKGSLVKEGGHFDPLIPNDKTANNLAKEYGVSAATIKRDAKFAEAVDTIGDTVGPEAKAEILSGKGKLGKGAVVAAAALPPKKMAEAVQTGRVPKAAKPPKSGQIRKDPRLWPEIVGLIGKTKNRVDELNRQRPHGNLYRVLIRQLDDCERTLSEWKKAVA